MRFEKAASFFCFDCGGVSSEVQHDFWGKNKWYGKRVLNFGRAPVDPQRKVTV